MFRFIMIYLQYNETKETREEINQKRALWGSFIRRDNWVLSSLMRINWGKWCNRDNRGYSKALQYRAEGGHTSSCSA